MFQVLLLILAGLLIGALWFHFGERVNKKSVQPMCWERLHYLNKERFPLYIVHLKSVIAGIILIVLACTKWKYKNECIAFIGSSIIGLHIAQVFNEFDLIKRKGN